MKKTRNTKKLIFKLLTRLFVLIMPFMAIFSSGYLGGNTAYAASGTGIENKIAELKQKYQHGQYWHRVNGVNTVTSIPCVHPDNSVYECNQNATNGCGHNYLGWQCVGLAGQIFEEIFGERVTNYEGTRTDKENIKIGDYVRIRNNSHSFIVTSRNGDEITGVECNWNAPCMIEWGNKHYISEVSGFYHATNYDAVNNEGIPQGTPMPNGGSRIIPDGDYQIVTAADTNKCLTIDSELTTDGANAAVYPAIGEPSQVFTIQWLGTDEGYKITYKHSGLSLTVDGNEPKLLSGLNVNQYKWYGSLGQKWVIKDAGNGYYTIQARCSGFHLDVNSTNVQIEEASGTASQKWKFIPFGSPISGGSQVIPDGNYQIVTAANTDKCLTIDNELTTNGANAAVYPAIGNPNQVFTIQWLGTNEGYKITYKRSGLSLTVDGKEPKLLSGLNVDQYNWYGSPGQKWVIKDADNGYYTIQARCSGFYLDVDSTNVQIGKANGTASQK